MTVHAPQRIDRRILIRRSAAAATLAGLLRGWTLPVSAQPTPALDDTGAKLVAGNTAFALDVYNELRRTADGNLFFSPYSISLALAMTYAGAAGETADQMANTLGFPLPDAGVHEAFAALTADLDKRGNSGWAFGRKKGARGLRIASALWAEQSYPFNPAFMAELDDSYGAGLELTDFTHAPDAARDDINAWVQEQTEDRIKDIVPPGAITSLTRLVLANAIYFYGSWENTFEVTDTDDDTFHLIDGTTVTVPFMRQREHFSYLAGEGFQAIELPYADSNFAMTIVLPDEGQFEAFEDGLDAQAFQDVIDGESREEVRLFLPKFDFEFDASMADTLQALGMTDAFDPALADFSGMVKGAPPEPLCIGDVLHKAFVSVDEEGTEAAAATVVIMGTTAAPGEPEEPIELRIDRPFLFAIRDTQTGTVLFLGRMMNPSPAS